MTKHLLKNTAEVYPQDKSQKTVLDLVLFVHKIMS